MLRVQEGDILITRSGTIGKVTYATKDLAKNYIISDDLVRVRVQDENLRAYLVVYFTSETALSLMLLDEYGSVQQHLQPRHIQEMIIPIPDDWKQAENIGLGNPVYPPAWEELAKHGISCAGKRAVQVKKSDYAEYDYLICMDTSNLRNLSRIIGADKDGKVSLLLDYAGRTGQSIADPWYTGNFGVTYADVVEGCAGLLAYLRQHGEC